jgi:hypothetical protein
MTVNPAEVRMLTECLANLEYLFEKIPEPKVKQSFQKQRDGCEDRLAELESMQKAATQS